MHGQRFDPSNGRDRQIRVQMRKEIATARWFPPQAGQVVSDGDQEQVALALEVPRGGFAHLCSGREVNEAVARVDGSAGEHARRFGRTPQDGGDDLEDEGRPHGAIVSAVRDLRH